MRTLRKNHRKLVMIGQRDDRQVRQASDLFDLIILADLKGKKVNDAFQSDMQPINYSAL